MTITPHNQPHTPQLQVDLDEILSGIPFVAMHICDECEVPVTLLIIDIKRLIEELRRLHSALTGERLISANLRAAIRAALGAHDDGEPDPLAYLRDELPDTGHPASEPGWS
jgi:hypothetical protein